MTTIASMEAETATTITATEITIGILVSQRMRIVTSVGRMTGIGIATLGLTMIEMEKVIAIRAGGAVSPSANEDRSLNN
jgi:hypothetical protein